MDLDIGRLCFSPVGRTLVVNETLIKQERFAWQEGDGGFTVSKSVVAEVEAYIARQKEHHRRFDFKTEFLELLRRHGIEFDEHDVFQ